MTAEHSLKPDLVVRRAPGSTVDLQQAEGAVKPGDCVLAAKNGRREEGHVDAVAQAAAADLALVHSLMGHYGRMHHDVQKLRVATGNRVAAMKKDNVPAEHRVPLVHQMAELKKTEHALELHLTRLTRRHPMRKWVEQAPGIALPGFARLMGVIGSLDRFSNVAKLWAYLGMHVVEGRAVKRQHGVKCNWAPAGTALCHQWGESIVKVNRGPYRAAYDMKKAYYEAERPGWLQVRRHEAAKRYAVKELLKDMWVEWRRTAVEAPLRFAPSTRSSKGHPDA